MTPRFTIAAALAVAACSSAEGTSPAGSAAEDSGGFDAAAQDGAASDSGSSDGGVQDAAQDASDSGSFDGSLTDSGTSDASDASRDGEVLDSSTGDAASSDAGSDGGFPPATHEPCSSTGFCWISPYGPAAIRDMASIPGGSVLTASEDALTLGTAQGLVRLATPFGGAQSVYATGPRDFWAIATGACGADGNVWRGDGTTWARVRAPRGCYSVVRGSGSSNVWVAGSFGHLARFDGNVFREVGGFPNSDTVSALAVVSAREIYATHERLVARWDGRSFSDETLSEFPNTILSGASVLGSDVYAIGGGNLYRRGVRGFDRVRVSGQASTITNFFSCNDREGWGLDLYLAPLAFQRGSGASFAEVRAQNFTKDDLGFLTVGACDARSGELWIGGDGLVRGELDGLRRVVGRAAQNPFAPVFATSEADVDAYLAGTPFEYDGAAWTTGTAASGLNVLDRVGSITFGAGLAGSAARDAGAGFVYATGLSSNSSSSMNAITAIDADHALAVGRLGNVLSYANGTWRQSFSGSANHLLAVHGVAPNDAWAVGEAGTIQRWDGANFTRITSGVTATLRAVRARSATEAWAAGDAGTVLRWDGASWSRVRDAAWSAKNVTALALRGAEIWLAIEGSALVRITSTIDVFPTGFSQSVRSIAFSSSRTVFLGGDRGMLLRGRP